jgi:hypothetical protein
MNQSNNEINLVQNLSAIFNNKTKVLTEIFQNARHAKIDRFELILGNESGEFDIPTMEATHNILNSFYDWSDSFLRDIYALDMQVSSFSLTIKYSGVGVDGLGGLLGDDIRLSELLCMQDNPLGMGVIAMIFACPKISIASRGKVRLIDTAKLLRGEVIDGPVETNTPSIDSVITLHNMRGSLSETIIAIHTLSKTSSIPIVVNSTVLESKYKIESLVKDGYEIHDTPLGEVLVRPKCFDTTISVIYKDIIVYGEVNHTSKIFLFANDSIQGQIPDKEKLIFDTEQKIALDKALDDVVTDLHIMRLQDYHSSMNDDQAFISEYFTQTLKYVPELLSKIDFVPGYILTKVSHVDLYDYPKPDTFKGVLSRSSALNLVIYDDDVDIGLDGSLAVQYAIEQNSYALNTALPDGHWLFELALPFSEVVNHVTISVDNAVEVIITSDWIFSLKALIADKITVECEGVSFEVLKGFSVQFSLFGEDRECNEHDEALANNTFFIPKNSIPSMDARALLLTRLDYIDEDDEFWGEELTADALMFHRALINA